MNMLPGDYIALVVIGVPTLAIAIGHYRAIRNDRRAQRELDRRLGHPARQARATRDPRVIEHHRS